VQLSFTKEELKDYAKNSLSFHVLDLSRISSVFIAQIYKVEMKVKQIRRTSNSLFALVLLATTFFNDQLLASYTSTIKSDEIVLLGATDEIPNNRNCCMDV